jgi:membrane associated rhomboid family serine protease
MVMRRSMAFMLAAVLFLTATEAFPLPKGTHAPGERHIFRTVCTLGFGLLGTYAGVNLGWSASKNYSTEAAAGIIGMIGGGVGGYFIGRKIDKSRIKSSKPDPQTIKEAQKRAVDLLLAKDYGAELLRPAPRPLQ